MNIKLFCIPYAGGSAMCYLKWRKYLIQDIELRPLELSGRGYRIGSKLYDSFEEAVSDLLKIIERQITDEYYVILGHSLGALLAYELGQALCKDNYPTPLHMFFLGQIPPQHQKKLKRYFLPDKKFIEEIVKFGGTPPEIFEDEELYSYFMPPLRADFKIHDTYCYKPESKLNCDFSIITGNDDASVNKDNISGWKDLSAKCCKIYNVDGGHMFINENVAGVTDIINKTIKNIAFELQSSSLSFER